MDKATNAGKIGPCDKCGTVRRVFQAEWVIEKKRDNQTVQRRRWLCLTCYQSALPI